MGFLTSFMTGGIQRQLDRWGEEDAAIADRIKKLGEKLVTADDNATQKVDKLGKVAGILNSKYGKNGIYQLSYQVDNNAIDFNDDVDDIAERVSKFQVPEDYIKNIANPYDYLGEQSQSMYNKDMEAYNAFASNLSMGDKTSNLLIPKRDFKQPITALGEAPTIGAEPITSAMPDVDKSDIESNAYGKLAYLVNNNIPLSEAGNKEALGNFALDPLEMNLIKGDVAETESAEEILQKIMFGAAEDQASIEVLRGNPREEILEKISNTLGIIPEPVTFSATDTSQITQDPNVSALMQDGYNVIANTNALSDSQKNLPRLNLDFDRMDENEIMYLLGSLKEGTLIEFISNGQTYFVEY